MNEDNDKELLRKRVYAFGLDMIFITLFSKAIIFSFSSYLKDYMLIDKVFTPSTVDYYFEQLSPIILLTIFNAYFIVGHYIGLGLTIGKSIFEIQIISNSQDELDLVDSIMVSFGYIISILSLGIVLVRLPFFKNRSLMEILTKTKTIDIKSKENQKNLLRLRSRSYDLKDQTGS